MIFVELATRLTLCCFDTYVIVHTIYEILVFLLLYHERVFWKFVETTPKFHLPFICGLHKLFIIMLAISSVKMEGLPLLRPPR